MNHDPMCPYQPDVAVDYGEWKKGKPCYCGLISRVRADCLEKVEGAYIVGSDGKVLNPSHPEYSHDGTETWNAAVSTAVAYMTGKID